MGPSRFTCEQVFARLDDYVDRELSSEEMRMIQEHLETCAVCAGEHHFESTVIAEVRDRLQRIDMPAGLAAKISEQLGRATTDDEMTR
jgi:anti-sigma factor (TIGR02949 family)